MRASVLITVCALIVPVAAQDPTPVSFATPVGVDHASGSHTNGTASRQLVHSHVLAIAGTPSLRVFFSQLVLGPQDWLDVTSVLDGSHHRITAAEAVKWSNSSAFFNGDTLLLDLWAAPGSTVSFEVDYLLVGVPPAGLDSLCGVDNRVASTDNRTCRFLNSSGSAACTGWLGGPDDCAFSAGHCFPTYYVTAEFNAPSSTSSGALQHPAVQFQYPVDPATISEVASGTGNDWGMCKLLPNNLGQSAAANFGWYTLGFFIPTTGETTRITGVGTDDGITNQTLQTDTGPYFGTAGTALRYTVDTTGGNSGSPVIHEATGQAIGIHTHGGCGTSGYNTGTSLTNAGFLAAWSALCSLGPTFSLAATTGGGADLTLQVTNLPAGATQGFTLASFDTSGPVNQGPALGLYPDLITLTLLGQPAIAGSPWHFPLPAPPAVYPAAPLVFPTGTLGFPPSTSLDVTVVVLDATYSILEVTQAQRVTF